jgi:hypothetical protein
MNDSRPSRRLFPMSKSFNLDFHGTEFTVLKASLFNLFEDQPEFVTKARYEVQSRVSIGVFELFVKALETGTKVPVTKDNARELSHLAKEFWLEDRLSEFSALQTDSAPESMPRLSE